MEKRKIILVDDKQAYRTAVRELLKRIGNIEIIGEAANGKEFLGMLDTQKPDIVFMDIEMPEMNGIEATKLALEKYPSMIIIGLSMYHDNRYIDELIKAGARGYLLKLSDNTNLFRTILQHPMAEIFFSKEIEYGKPEEENKKSTVLIVDDFESTRFVIDYSLSQVGYEVLQAVNGNEAYEKLQNGNIDLVITDYNMPGMDGVELTAKMRKLDNYKTTPVLLLTTELPKDKKSDAKQAGVTGLLTKPFTMDKLLAFVKKALR